MTVLCCESGCFTMIWSCGAYCRVRYERTLVSQLLAVLGHRRRSGERAAGALNVSEAKPNVERCSVCVRRYLCRRSRDTFAVADRL